MRISIFRKRDIMKIKIVLYTLDQVYAQYFSNFMLSQENAERFSTKIYTDLALMEENTRNKKQHILLTDQKIEQSIKRLFEKTIILSESHVNNTEDTDIIFKYQPLKDILSQSLAKLYEKNGKMHSVSTSNKDKSVISFYSGSSGTGKTILSLCLARHLASLNHSVFYLNLESLHTTKLYFKEEKQSSAEVLYYLKNNHDRLLSKIESLKSRDSLTNIDYFSLPINPEEMELLTEEQTGLLIQTLKQSLNYDYIIVDLESALHERIRSALEMSDEIFWILTSDEISFERSKNIIENDLLGITVEESKVRFILNKYGKREFSGFDTYNFGIEERINFDERFLEINEETKLHSDTVIGNKLTNLLQSNEHVALGVSGVADS